MDVVLPDNEKRTAVIGSTGSGKTRFAVWLLSTRDFDKRRWFIFDFKGDELIEAIDAKEISVHKKPPEKPGLYVVRPIPERDDKAVEAFLWAIWKDGWAGIYIDEGYMLGSRNPALNACLTQGRSKKIEMIILSQRPVWMSRFVFSEANFFAIFNLTDEDDRKQVARFVGPGGVKPLPDFHSTWYDVKRQRGVVFSPVPGDAELLAVFDQRLRRKTRRI